mmetsp:Transcript_7974/g.17298  ORF Transcript_7974/g.17298 Transcript_7974/m.17298 type:complete len:412 (+) Transcript_7974:70-1305(+)
MPNMMKCVLVFLISAGSLRIASSFQSPVAYLSPSLVKPSFSIVGLPLPLQSASSFCSPSHAHRHPPRSAITTTTTCLRNANQDTTSNENKEEEDDDSTTVSTIELPNSKVITLIGTAHLSQKSNDQVERLINELQPNVVMVELDPSRLPRIGIENIGDISVKNVVSADDIELPNNKSTNNNNNKSNNPLQKLLQKTVIEAFTRIARALLTNMYNDMSKSMDQGISGGGEFQAAISAAEACPNCNTLVLGDRSSLETIRRAATLAIEGGDVFGVLDRLQKANEEEMTKLSEKVQQKLEEEKKSNGIDGPVEDGEVQVAMIEALKEDSGFRDRLFEKLERDVPEFTTTFLKERDYIMSESIRRELVQEGNDVVVGVVGLGHVPGMEKNLNAMFGNEKVPLLVEEEKEPATLMQ